MDQSNRTHERRICWVVAVGLLAILAGCSLIPKAGDWYRIEPLVVYSPAPGNPQECETIEPKEIAAGENSWNKDPKMPRSFSSGYLDCRERKAANETERNAYLESLIGRSEEMCSQHLAEVMATSGGVGLSTSWFASIFSALATANPGAAATNYAATSTAFSAGGVAFNANIYHGLVTPAIVRDIKKYRETFLNTQLVAFKQQALAMAPASAARRLAVQFHESCSFFNGLAQLVAPPGNGSAPVVTAPGSGGSAPVATAPGAGSAPVATAPGAGKKN